jgi:hypothetical protein
MPRSISLNGKLNIGLEMTAIGTATQPHYRLYSCVRPPSTVSSVPRMKEDLSDSRNST